jgi:carboxyl-terminal processing protease
MSSRVRITLISTSCFVIFYAVLGGLLGNNGDKRKDPAYKYLGVYSEVVSRIKSDYVTEPDLRKVTGGAIRGLLEALDPYSTYMTPEEFNAYQKNPEPGPANVGIFVAKRLGFATVVSILPGSPAEKTGVKIGDLIDRVDSLGTRELSVVQIQRLLAGEPGTTVDLTLVREARGEPQKVPVVRAAPTNPPVVAKMVDSGAGYVRVSLFSKGTANRVAARLKELTIGGADKVVLDLRNCAGGDPDEAVQITGLFINEGLVGYLQGQRFPRQDLVPEQRGFVTTLPLAVLINQSTAGPAELVASSVAGNKRGEVLGSRSFGIGVYQKVISLDDGSALLLSVAKYYGPDGKAIQGNGVTPTITEDLSSDSSPADDDELAAPENFGDSNDRLLRKAIEVLKQKTPQAA